jgi:prevent-host-death family protein
MPAEFELRDAKAHLCDLVDRVRLGEEIVILQAGEPVARLVPEVQRRQPRQPRRPGSAEGQFRIADTFDDPLPDDLLDLFEGKG